MALPHLDLQSSHEESSDEESGDDELSFCETPNNFMCMICLNTAWLPQVNFCGHFFCGKCINRWVRNNGSDAKCPLCRSLIGKNTLIPLIPLDQPSGRQCKSIFTQRNIASKNGCFSMYFIPPRMGMFTWSEKYYFPKDLPRTKPLPPQLMRYSFPDSFSLVFYEPALVQRCLILFIMTFLLWMCLNLG